MSQIHGRARAIQRHETGEAVVIPVILRPCDWHPAPFGKLNATPPDGKPVTKWADRDEAFLEVAKAVRAAAARLSAASQTRSPIWHPDTSTASATALSPKPRSSNLRIAKIFSERDRDLFKVDTFEYIARFFENSLEELGKRNLGIEGHFRRVDASRFFAAIYQNGEAEARCTIFMGGLGNGICYVHGETTSSSSMNESLRVEADDQAMFLRAMAMAHRFRAPPADGKLSQEGAAELYWEMLIEPLQRR